MILSMKKDFKIISWNVNGIRAVHRKNLFVPFLEKYNPDIICLQETKAEKHQSEIDLSNYKEFWNSASKKGYSGTAIFSKIEPIRAIYDLPNDIAKKYNLSQDTYGDLNKEGRVIAAEFGKFFLVCVYTPNSKDDLSRLTLRYKYWDVAFLEYVRKLEKEKPVIFCGDLNVAHTPDDLARPKENIGNKGFTNEEREGVQKIIDCGFADTFRIFTKGNGHYTWWSHFANARARNVGWRIDYFFVSAKIAKNVKKAQVFKDVLGSDHCPISLEISL